MELRSIWKKDLPLGLAEVMGGGGGSSAASQAAGDVTQANMRRAALQMLGQASNAGNARL